MSLQKSGTESDGSMPVHYTPAATATFLKSMIRYSTLCWESEEVVLDGAAVKMMLGWSFVCRDFE